MINRQFIGELDWYRRIVWWRDPQDPLICQLAPSPPGRVRITHPSFKRWGASTWEAYGARLDWADGCDVFFVDRYHLEKLMKVATARKNQPEVRLAKGLTNRNYCDQPAVQTELLGLIGEQAIADALGREYKPDPKLEQDPGYDFKIYTRYYDWLKIECKSCRYRNGDLIVHSHHQAIKCDWLINAVHLGRHNGGAFVRIQGEISRRDFMELGQIKIYREENGPRAYATRDQLGVLSLKHYPKGEDHANPRT